MRPHPTFFSVALGLAGLLVMVAYFYFLRAYHKKTCRLYPKDREFEE